MSNKKPRRTTKAKPQASTQKANDAGWSVPRHEQQLAVINDIVLDIEHAHRVLRAKPRRTVRIDVEAWARLYGLDGDPNSPVAVGPLFDPIHALTTDLRRPLIVVTFTTDDGDVELIADGCHRLARAFLEGRDSLPAHVLTAAETRTISLIRL